VFVAIILIGQKYYRR
jgi:camphor resistance protein CrcB